MKITNARTTGFLDQMFIVSGNFKCAAIVQPSSNRAICNLVDEWYRIDYRKSSRLDNITNKK